MPPLKLGPGDIEGIFNALRPRFRKWISSGGFATQPPTTVAPHTHQASDIGFDPAGVEWTGYLSAEEVQAALEEHDDEKLARSGVQPMRGSLGMDDGAGPYNIFDINNLTLSGAAGQGNVTGVRDISMVTAIVGEGVIDGPRVIHMAGDDDDDEALIDGVERVVFNLEPTKSLIQQLSLIEWNPAVTPGTDYTEQLAQMSWSDLEGTMICVVASGA